MTKNLESAVKNLKVSGDIVDLVLAGIVKYFAEKALTPLVGNGNLVSGISKLGIGVVLDMFGGSNKLAKIGKTAMVLDGVEDLTQSTIKMIMGKVPALGGNKSDAIATI